MPKEERERRLELGLLTPEEQQTLRDLYEELREQVRCLRLAELRTRRDADRLSREITERGDAAVAAGVLLGRVPKEVTTEVRGWLEYVD